MNQNRIKLKGTPKFPKPKMTGAKIILWSKLRTKQEVDAQFYKQKTIGKYKVDFYSPEAKLVIELDSGQYNIESVKVKERDKDDYLKRKGLKVLRIENIKVRRNIKNVIQEIKNQVSEKKG